MSSTKEDKVHQLLKLHEEFISIERKKIDEKLTKIYNDIYQEFEKCVVINGFIPVIRSKAYKLVHNLQRENNTDSIKRFDQIYEIKTDYLQQKLENLQYIVFIDIYRYTMFDTIQVTFTRKDNVDKSKKSLNITNKVIL